MCFSEKRNILSTHLLHDSFDLMVIHVCKHYTLLKLFPQVAFALNITGTVNRLTKPSSFTLTVESARNRCVAESFSRHLFPFYGVV